MSRAAHARWVTRTGRPSVRARRLAMLFRAFARRGPSVHTKSSVRAARAHLSTKQHGFGPETRRTFTRELEKPQFAGSTCSCAPVAPVLFRRCVHFARTNARNSMDFWQSAVSEAQARSPACGALAAARNLGGLVRKPVKNARVGLVGFIFSHA